MGTKEVVFLTAGLLIGGSTGYLVAKKQLEAKYAAIAEEQVASVKEVYETRYADVDVEQGDMEDFSDSIRFQKPEEDSTPAVKEHSGASFFKQPSDRPRTNYSNPKGLVIAPSTTEVVEGRYEVGVTIVENPDRLSDDVTEWTRDDREPYVITLEEFQEGFQEGYGNETLTYYEFDNTLCDEDAHRKGGDSGIIPDLDEIVGEQNLQYFGKGSEDEDIVYIRNERIHMDYEVRRNTDEGGYALIVLGIAPDPEFVESRRPQRMRSDD